jgi:excisionase family DNA binding protein
VDSGRLPEHRPERGYGRWFLRADVDLLVKTSLRGHGPLGHDLPRRTLASRGASVGFGVTADREDVLVGAERIRVDKEGGLVARYRPSDRSLLSPRSVAAGGTSSRRRISGGGQSRIVMRDRHFVAPQDRLLTTRDVAEMLELPETTIRAMTQDGRLRSVKLGQAVRFRRQDVTAFVRAAAGEEEPEPPPAEIVVSPARFAVAAGDERIEVAADSFEVVGGATVVLRDPDESLVAVFAPGEWQWVNRIAPATPKQDSPSAQRGPAPRASEQPEAMPQ